MLPDLGNVVYDIRAGEQNWAGIGGEVTRTPRVGIPAPHLPTEWLTVTVHVSNSINPAEIPAQGLSVYANGQERLGTEGEWSVVRCTPAGGIRLVELTTRR